MNIENNGLEVVRMRNNFYRDNYRRVIFALLILLCTNGLLVLIVIYQVSNRPSPKYFASTTDGRIMQMFPLDQPMLSSEEIIQWTSRVAVSVYSYNFVNWREAMQSAQDHFTSDGWGYFEDALKGSRMLETVLKKKLIVSATITGAPVILDRGVVNSRYTWKVQMPMLITYQSSSEQTQQSVVVTLIVSRVPVVDIPKGIAVVSFVSSTGTVDTSNVGISGGTE